MRHLTRQSNQTGAPCQTLTGRPGVLRMAIWQEGRVSQERRVKLLRSWRKVSQWGPATQALCLRGRNGVVRQKRSVRVKSSMTAEATSMKLTTMNPELLVLRRRGRWQKPIKSTLRIAT